MLSCQLAISLLLHKKLASSNGWLSHKLPREMLVTDENRYNMCARCEDR